MAELRLSDKVALVQYSNRNMTRPMRSLKRSPFAWPDYRTGKPEWHLVNYDAFVQEGFNLNQIVYSAIMYKVRALGQVPLKAYTGDPEHPDQLPDTHPLAKLTARPNAHQSFPEFQGQNITYLNLSGNAYIFFPRRARGAMPDEMYSLRPDRVFVIPLKEQQDKGLLGYLYVPEGRSQWHAWSRTERRRALESGAVLAIPPEDLMHVKLPNPGDPLEGMGYGLSPLYPAARPTDVDNKVTEFLKLFFDKGTMLQGVLSFDVPLDPDDIPGIRDRWKEVYGGYENWTEPGILDQGGKWTRITPTFAEMGFSDIDSRNETRILGPFGVPPILVGTRSGMQRSTFSNHQEARRACWEDTLVPENTMFEMDYRHYLSEGDMFVAMDYSRVPALQKDIPLLVKAWVDLVTYGVPKDEATRVVGLPLMPLEDGDVIYMPLNLVPVGGREIEKEIIEEEEVIEEEDEF